MPLLPEVCGTGTSPSLGHPLGHDQRRLGRLDDASSRRPGRGRPPPGRPAARPGRGSLWARLDHAVRARSRCRPSTAARAAPGRRGWPARPGSRRSSADDVVDHAPRWCRPSPGGPSPACPSARSSRRRRTPARRPRPGTAAGSGPGRVMCGSSIGAICGVVRDHLGLGVAGRRVEHLVQVGQRERRGRPPGWSRLLRPWDEVHHYGGGLLNEWEVHRPFGASRRPGAWCAGARAAGMGGLADWSPTGRRWRGRTASVLPVRTSDRRGGGPQGGLAAPRRPSTEHLALRAWAGDGAVRLLRADPRRFALLLERAEPGRDLTRSPLREACEVVAGALRPAAPAGDAAARPAVGARRPAGPTRSPSWAAATWSRDASPTRPAASPGPSPTTRRPTGPCCTPTCTTPTCWPPRGSRGWSIDPKPMAGDPAYEVAPMLWNRWDEAMADGDLRTAIAGPDVRAGRRRRARRGPGPGTGWWCG